ncbi:nuclear transport factor 2 family protein [Phreatobacter sp.]|uniref:nuclear transport factor 2 family protein n=1 Tax=Phreatobacter sp. TaxID=1966341 RepID=UPI003F70AD55
MTLPDLIAGYFAVWNEADATRRAARLAAIWADGALYCDPSVHAGSPEAFLVHIAQVRERRPGAVWSLVGTPDAHHDLVRFAWNVVGPAGNEIRRGIDVLVLSGNGTQISRVFGFFDDPATAA